MRAMQSKKDTTFKRAAGATCNNCVHSFYDDELRYCQRNPPAMLNATSSRGVFPTVLDSDWCGEFLGAGAPAK